MGDGGARQPVDDVEALGWVLINGLFRVLPWFAILSLAYTNWSEPMVRHVAVKQVQSCKQQLLDADWDSLGRCSYCLAEMPKDLFSFVQACRQDGVSMQMPDYGRLSKMLGARDGVDSSQAEQDDMFER